MTEKSGSRIPFCRLYITGAKSLISVCFSVSSSFRVLKGQVVEQNIEYQIIQDESGEYRQFIDHFNGDRPYSVTSYDWDNRRIDIFYLPDVRQRFSDTRLAFFHLGWEKILLREGAYAPACVPA